MSGLAQVPVEPTEAMLRPFYACPPDELKLAWMAMLKIVEVQARRESDRSERKPAPSRSHPLLAYQRVLSEEEIDAWREALDKIGAEYGPIYPPGSHVLCRMAKAALTPEKAMCASSETERRVNQIAYPGIDKRVASMKNDEPATMHEAQMTDCKHCWHGTGRMLMSNPPLSVDVCCECGAERGLRVRQPIEPGLHGPFAPEKRLGTTSGSNVGAAQEVKP